MAILDLNSDEAGGVFVLACRFVPLARPMTFARPRMRIASAGIIPRAPVLTRRPLLQAHPLHAAIRVHVFRAHVYCIGRANSLNSTAVATPTLRAEMDARFATADKEKSICEVARGRAQAAYLAKPRFFATMRSAVRTPLYAIRAFPELGK